METLVFVQAPRVRFCSWFKAEEAGSFYFPLHIHENLTELLLILKGEGIFRIGDRTYEASAGMLLCYNQSTWHEERNTSPSFLAVHLSLDKLKIEGLPDNHFLDEKIRPVLELNEHFFSVKTWFTEIVNEKNKTVPQSDFIADQLLGAMLGRLARIVYDQPDSRSLKLSSSDAVLKAKLHLEENYHKTITLEQLAQLTFLSPYHLGHLFKRDIGISPIQYLINYRMEVAKQLLHSTPYTIKEIAERVGYESETYFHNLFRKVTGQTPGYFRK